jgi:hypothetical protein
MIKRGLGLKYSHILVSVHEDYSSYAEFDGRLKQNGSWTVTDSTSFLVNLNDEFGFLSFSALAEHLIKLEQKNARINWSNLLKKNGRCLLLPLLSFPCFS